MCWLFADTWLEDPEEEAAAQTKAQDVWEYIPTRHQKKKRVKHVVVYPGDGRPVEVIQQQPAQPVLQYVVPTQTKVAVEPSWKKSSKHHGTAKGKGDGNGKEAHKKTDNTWEYVPSGTAKKSSSKKSSQKPVVVVAAPAPPPPAVQTVPYVYQPPAQPAPPVQYQPAPQVQYPPMPQYSYGYPQHMAYPAPAYYGYPGANQGVGMPFCPPGYTPIYAPAPVPAEQEKPKKPKTRKWQGRTKAEVEEDNMKIAQREGAYDARKVVPKDLKDDQMVWVVEVDGSHTLRAFAAVKDLKGEWKADPRFKDSWYFVREKEE